MKALVHTAPFQLEIQDMPIPVPGPSEVLVRVKAAGICGSDVHGYTGKTGRRQPPLVMGHEAAGIVAATGSDVCGIKEGEAVCFDSTIFCSQCEQCQLGQHNRCIHRSVLGVSTDATKRHGAMAEFLALPYWTICRMPTGLTFRKAALLEPLSIGLHAAAQAGCLQNRTVLIIGAGTIGLCTLMAVQLEQPTTILVTDIRSDRLHTARQLGADCISSATETASMARLMTGAQGVDITFEAAGVPASIDAAIRSTRAGGTIVLIGNAARMPPIDVQTVVSKELTLVGSYASAGEYAFAMQEVAAGRVDPTPLISGVFPLEEGGACFERLHKGETGLLKVLLEP